MIINGLSVLLGEPVEGVPSADGTTTSWQIEAGPYKATITEWAFDSKKYYKYELRVSGVAILYSTSKSVATIEEAIQIVEDTLRDYLIKKAVIEKRFGPEVIPNTILEYHVRNAKGHSSTGK